MRRNYAAFYIMLLLVQMLICNYLRLGPYLMLSLLPAMVFCLPLRLSTLKAMLIAFLTGLFADAFAEGLLGLNALALVPVAYVRRGLCRAIFGDELIERGNDFSMDKQGLEKVVFAVAVANAVFLGIYIAADGGGSMPIVFNAIKFAVSLIAGIILSLVVVDVTKPDVGR